MAYASPSSTRFFYNRDLLLRCVRNRPALRNILERGNGSEIARLVKCRDPASRDAQAAFLRVAVSVATVRDWETASRILDLVCTCMRLFDGDSSRLSLVLPATEKRHKEMAEMESTLHTAGMAGTTTPHVFEQIRADVQRRVAGPVHRGVRVLLLQDFHYLATALDAKLFNELAPNVVHMSECAFRAVRSYDLRSSDVFSVATLTKQTEDQRMHMLREQFTVYTAMAGNFMAGTYAAYVQGKSVDVAAELVSLWDLWGWWALYGGSTPEVREIGKALAGIVPSTCPVERAFSEKKSIHSVIRHRLTHDKVCVCTHEH